MPRKDDYPEFDDLRGLDLSRLNLDHIQIDEEELRSGNRPWFGFLILLLAIGGAVLWFPRSDYFMWVGSRNWVFFAVGAVGAVVGLALGRWLWGWLQTAARRQPPRPPRPHPEAPPSALQRWLLLVLGLSAAAGILWGLPALGLVSRDVRSSLWFAGAVGAVAVGVLLGRWLLMQAQAATAATPRPRPAASLPGYVKWITLAVLITMGLIALVAPALSGSISETMRFGLGTVGLAVGIVGAIWLARRVDEFEDRARSRQGRNPPLRR